MAVLGQWSPLPDWVLVALLAVLSLYIYGTWSYEHFRKSGVPFIKPSVPFFGSWAPVLLGRVSFSDHVNDLYTQGQGSRCMGMFFFKEPVLILRDPELIKAVGVKDFYNFMNHRITVGETVDPLMSKTLFSLQDKRWKVMRSILSPAFTSSKMKAMFMLVSECGEQMMEHLKGRCKDSTNGGSDEVFTMEMKDFYTRFTNDVIASAAFGISCDSFKVPANRFYLMGKEATNLGGLRAFIVLLHVLLPTIMEFLRVPVLSKMSMDFFRSLVHGTIATREQESIVRPDMIHLLMQARKGELKALPEEDEHSMIVQKGAKTHLEDDDITAQAVVFFLGGFDTSSALLCFSTYLLTIHSEVQHRLKEEIDSILEEYGNKLTYEGMQKMKYLDMVLSETLRMYPPIPTLDRTCGGTYTIPATESHPQVTIRKGEIVWVPVHGLHHDPEFFPEPERFDPERFSDENKHKIKPFTYLPFGVGPRVCIGQRFSLMEVKVALVHLLCSFSLHVVDKTSIPMKLKKTGFNLTAEAGFWTGIKPRRK